MEVTSGALDAACPDPDILGRLGFKCGEREGSKTGLHRQPANLQKQQEHLDAVVAACEGTGVAFSWAFDGTGTSQARHVVTDTRWKISLDRGLDIFQQYPMSDAFSLATGSRNTAPSSSSRSRISARQELKDNGGSPFSGTSEHPIWIVTLFWMRRAFLDLGVFSYYGIFSFHA